MDFTYRIFFLSHHVVSYSLNVKRFLASAVLGLENVQLDIDVLKSLILLLDNSLFLFKLLFELFDFSRGQLNFLWLLFARLNFFLGF